MISLSVLPFIRLTTSASVGRVDSFQIFNDFRELGPCCLRFSLIVEQAKMILLRRKRSPSRVRSEEHTSELQSQSNLVCRLLLENTEATPAPLTPRARKRRAAFLTIR